MLNLTLDDEERFWVKVDKTSDGCWPWIASLNKGTGYGQFMVRNPKTMAIAHRVAYQLTKGPIPEGLVLDHLCNVRRCVNPDHLEPVTQRENLDRARPPLKTHCVHGHAYTDENTYISPKLHRFCRTCAKAKNQAWRAAHSRAAITHGI